MLRARPASSGFQGSRKSKKLMLALGHTQARAAAQLAPGRPIFGVDDAGVGAIAGLTYAIVRHHKEMVVVGGALCWRRGCADASDRAHHANVDGRPRVLRVTWHRSLFRTRHARHTHARSGIHVQRD